MELGVIDGVFYMTKHATCPLVVDVLSLLKVDRFVECQHCLGGCRVPWIFALNIQLIHALFNCDYLVDSGKSVLPLY